MKNGAISSVQVANAGGMLPRRTQTVDVVANSSECNLPLVWLAMHPVGRICKGSLFFLSPCVTRQSALALLLVAILQSGRPASALPVVVLSGPRPAD